MGVFKRFGQKRASAKGFQTQKTASIDQQTFILEPILTPSGILDGQDNTPEPVVVDLETTPLPDIDLPDSDDAVETVDAAAIETDSIADGDTDLNVLAIDIADEELEPLDFVEKLDSTEVDSTFEASTAAAATTDSFTIELNTPGVEGDAPETVTADSIVDSDTVTENPTEATTNSPESEITVTSSETVDSPATNQATNETTELTESEITNSETKVLTNDSVSQIEPVESQTPEIADAITGAIPSDSFANASPQVTFEFDSGVFTVGETGEVSVDFLFDGGGYKGELAIFSLDGMQQFEPGSEAFIKEAASRALSGSELGHVAISDLTEGARFSGNLGEANQNQGAYLGVKTFTMRPGDTFGIMLVPNGKVEQVFDNPAIDGAVRPLFSLGTANPNDAFHTGQLVDVTGDGNTFVMEDMRVDTGSDKDYNDIIFQVRGATGSAISLDDAIASGKDWRNSDLGQALIAYAEPYINPEPVDELPIVVHLEPVTNPESAIANSPAVTTEPISTVTDNAIANSPAVTTEPIITTTEDAIANSPAVTTEPITNPENAIANSPAVITEPITNPENAIANSPTVTTEAVTESPVVSNTSTNQTTVTLPTTTEPSNTVEVVSSEPSPNVAETSITEINVVTEVTTNEVITSEPVSTNLPTIAESSNTEIEVVKPDTTVETVTSGIAVESTTSPLTTEVKVVTEVVDGGAIPADSFANASEPSTEVVAIETKPSVETAAPVTEVQSVTSSVVAENTTVVGGGEAIPVPAVQPETSAESVDVTATNSNSVSAIASETTTVEVAQSLPPIPPVKPPIQFEFPPENQPLVGVIDTGFAANNPDINYERIILGQDWIDGDANPLLQPGEGSEHGTHVLGVIAATQDNDIGIEGINDDAPIWLGRAIDSGKWADSLVEFVDAAKASAQPNAVVNLSLDLTQINPDGSVTTRYELTPEERGAIEYARQNNVLLVVAAGNDGGVMSALGQASQEFDNIITVGAAERVNDAIALSKAYDRADYSSYGYGLDIMADGGSIDNPILSTTGDGLGTMAGTSVATAKVTGAASQVWAANPNLSYRQVIELLKNTATDLKTPNWDVETGAGLLNIAAAVSLAKVTTPESHETPEIYIPDSWSGEGLVTPTERAAATEYGTYNPKVSSDFLKKVKTIGQNLGLAPEYLMAVMGFETGGTYSPSTRNPLSGATGLIQFMPATAQSLGTSVSALAKMTAIQQLDYVEKYLRPYKGRFSTLEDAYMAVLWPAAVGKGANHILFRSGSIEYSQNSGLDLNRDGVVTASEAANKVRQYLPPASLFATTPGNNNPNPGTIPVPGTPGQSRQYIVKKEENLWAIAQRELGNGNRWREIMKTPVGGTFTEAEARRILAGQTVYLPVKSQVGTGRPVTPPPSSTPTPVIPDWQKAIDKEAQEMGWLLGNPVGGYWDATTSPYGTNGKGRNYDNGTVHWSPQYGAVALWLDLQREYAEYASPNGSGGWLGFPTKREYPWNGGMRTDFEGGYIFWDGQRAKAYPSRQTYPSQPVFFQTSPDARFRAIYNWAVNNGYIGGFHNFHQADFGPPKGLVYGSILIKREAADWRDIPAAELGNPQTPEERFRAVYNWAVKNGYAGGYPNFHNADYGQGTVYGSILIKREAADWRDIPATELGNPKNAEELFRAISDWVARNGYVAGYPNFHNANYGNGTVYGVTLLKHGYAEWRDISSRDVSWETTPVTPPPPGTGNPSTGLPTSAASASIHFRKQPPNSADCGPSSLAMTLSVLGVTPSDVSGVRAKMPELNRSPWTNFEEIHGGIKNFGKSSTEFRDWENFDYHLSKGHPLVMFGLSSPTWAKQFPGGHPGSYVPHFIAILGKTNDGKYIVGDPLYSKPVEMDQNQLKAFIPNKTYYYNDGSTYTFNPNLPDAIAVF